MRSLQLLILNLGDIAPKKPAFKRRGSAAEIEGEGATKRGVLKSVARRKKSRDCYLAQEDGSQTEQDARKEELLSLRKRSRFSLCRKKGWPSLNRPQKNLWVISLDRRGEGKT